VALARTRVLEFGVGVGVAILVGIGAYFLRPAAPAPTVELENDEDFAAAEAQTQPEPPPPPETATAPAPVHPSAAPEPAPEIRLMEQLHGARAAGKHALAIQLAREGNLRFPESSFAPERHSILIHALADNEQRSEARGEAEFMVNHYPDSDWVREIERFTGAHRHRNSRLNDAGELEQY
jgi:hypothetical protein